MPDDRRPDPIDPEKPFVSMRDVIAEALERQAQLRPIPSPPKELPKTPTLPKQPRPARERKKEQERLRAQERFRRR